jgi:hypothetical protein
VGAIGQSPVPPTTTDEGAGALLAAYDLLRAIARRAERGQPDDVPEHDEPEDDERATSDDPSTA